MSVLVGTQEVLKLHNKEPGKARPANRDQSAVEGCPRSLRLHRRIAPDNARALTGLATFQVVGNPYLIALRQSCSSERAPEDLAPVLLFGGSAPPIKL